MKSIKETIERFSVIVLPSRACSKPAAQDARCGPLHKIGSPTCNRPDRVEADGLTDTLQWKPKASLKAANGEITGTQ